MPELTLRSDDDDPDIKIKVEPVGSSPGLWLIIHDCPASVWAINQLMFTPAQAHELANFILTSFPKE